MSLVTTLLTPSAPALAVQVHFTVATVTVGWQYITLR